MNIKSKWNDEDALDFIALGIQGSYYTDSDLERLAYSKNLNMNVDEIKEELDSRGIYKDLNGRWKGRSD